MRHLAPAAASRHLFSHCLCLASSCTPPLDACQDAWNFLDASAPRLLLHILLPTCISHCTAALQSLSSRWWNLFHCLRRAACLILCRNGTWSLHTSGTRLTRICWVCDSSPHVLGLTGCSTAWVMDSALSPLGLPHASHVLTSLEQHAGFCIELHSTATCCTHAPAHCLRYLTAPGCLTTALTLLYYCLSPWEEQSPLPHTCTAILAIFSSLHTCLLLSPFLFSRYLLGGISMPGHKTTTSSDQIPTSTSTIHFILILPHISPFLPSLKSWSHIRDHLFPGVISPHASLHHHSMRWVERSSSHMHLHLPRFYHSPGGDLFQVIDTFSWETQFSLSHWPESIDFISSFGSGPTSLTYR